MASPFTVTVVLVSPICRVTLMLLGCSGTMWTSLMVLVSKPLAVAVRVKGSGGRALKL